MRCNKAREYLSLEMDGRTPPDVAGLLETHLDSCADCQAYRTDLLLGRRLLAATEPELPENFDWKLQLRLNQTLKETAGEAAFPWEEARTDRWAWLRNFGAAAAVGMAAVLTVAIFLGPTGAPPASRPLSENRALAETISDRLPLETNLRWSGMGRSGLQRQVSGIAQQPVDRRLRLEGGWSGSDRADLVTITRLRGENRALTGALVQAQRQIRQMQAQLDTSGPKALDLED